MSRIRVIIDPDREGRPSSLDLLLESDEDLIQGRLRLRKAQASAEAITIWVRSAALADRFADLVNDPAVAVERFDIRSQVASALNVVSLPDIITDDLAQERDLLSLARKFPRHEGESGLAWCMRALLGDRWAKASVTEDDVTSILWDLSGEESPELRSLFEWRLSTWARTSECRELWQWLSEDPYARAACLTACAAVRGFEETAIQWLTQADHPVDTVSEAMSLLDGLQRWRAIRGPHLHPTVDHQLEQELAARLQLRGPAAVQAALPTSGGAQRAVVTYLAGRAEAGRLLTLDESETLSHWSAEAPEDAALRRIAASTTLLTDRPPPPPLHPDADWPTVTHWLEGDYMPFYLSRAVSNRLEETVECVTGFERWLIDGYRTLMESTEAGLQWFCADGEALIKDAMVVLVLLDGVPSPAVRWLQSALAEEPEVSVLSDRVYLAPIPTVTAVDKPAMLSSRLPDQAGMIDAEALADAFGVSVDSCQAVSSLDEVGILFPRQVILRHYQHVDSELLHKPMAPLERWLQCRRLLEDFAQEVRLLMSRAVGQGVPLRLGCASDHGWTELPRSACRVDVPADLSEAVSHGRVLEAVADTEYGVAVPGSQFFLREDYTIARGYSYFARRPRGAVHGGMTPQEVVVSGFWLTTGSTAKTADLILHIAGEIRRAVTQNAVSLQLSNPNAEAAVVCDIQLESISVPPALFPLSVPPTSSERLQVTCDASGCTDMLQVRGLIEWRTQSGSRVRQTVSFVVPTVGAASSDRAFEDMFR